MVVSLVLRRKGRTREGDIGFQDEHEYAPCCEKPWSRAPTTMTSEPQRMDHRRPRRSLTMGMSGSDRMAPSE